MVIPLMNRIQLCFWQMLETIIPGFFPDKRERDDLLRSLVDLREELNQAQESLLQRGQALKCMDQRHTVDREIWQRQFDLMASEIVAKNSEITDLITRLERTEAQAMTDALTGLLNRRGLKEMFEHQFGILARGRTPDWIALVSLDIDHFKTINDTYGHAAGDAVLVQVATLLRANRRPSDIVARIGGEEMVVVLPQATADNAFNEAEEIRKAIGKAFFVIPTDDGSTKTIQVITTSCGVAAIVVTANDKTRPTVALNQLLVSADAALYRAKRAGRDNTQRSDQPSKQE